MLQKSIIHYKIVMSFGAGGLTHALVKAPVENPCEKSKCCRIWYVCCHYIDFSSSFAIPLIKLTKSIRKYLMIFENN